MLYLWTASAQNTGLRARHFGARRRCDGAMVTKALQARNILMHRILGGNPLSTVFRLAVLSVVAGMVLSLLGLSPFELLVNVGSHCCNFTIWAMAPLAGC